MKENKQQSSLHQWQVASARTAQVTRGLLEPGQRAQFLSGAPLTFFHVTGRPLWALSTHLCNWSRTSRKHRQPHAQRALMQDITAHPSALQTLRATGMRSTGEEASVATTAMLRHGLLLSYRLSTSTHEDQAQTLKTLFPFDTHLLFRVSFPLTSMFLHQSFPHLLQFHNTRNRTPRRAHSQAWKSVCMRWLKLTVKLHTYGHLKDRL